MGENRVERSDNAFMSDVEPRTRWGRYVARVLKKHGTSGRGQRIRTGIPGSTVNGWLHDIPPQQSNAIAFASGLGEDVNEALEEAGFEPLPTTAAEETVDAIEAVLREVSERYGVDIALRQHQGDEALDPEAVQRWAERIEDFAKWVQATEAKEKGE